MKKKIAVVTGGDSGELGISLQSASVIKENIDKRYALFERLDKALIPSTFIKDYVKVAFGRYAKENGIKFNITDVEFEVKRIHSDNKDDVICHKRMGFTPKTDVNGIINWYSVKDLGQVKGLYIDTPDSAKKTTIELIKQQVDKKNTGKSEKLISQLFPEWLLTKTDIESAMEKPTTINFLINSNVKKLDLHMKPNSLRIFLPKSTTLKLIY